MLWLQVTGLPWQEGGLMLRLQVTGVPWQEGGLMLQLQVTGMPWQEGGLMLRLQVTGVPWQEEGLMLRLQVGGVLRLSEGRVLRLPVGDVLRLGEKRVLRLARWARAAILPDSFCACRAAARQRTVATADMRRQPSVAHVCSTTTMLCCVLLDAVRKAVASSWPCWAPVHSLLCIRLVGARCVSHTGCV